MAAKAPAKSKVKAAKPVAASKSSVSKAKYTAAQYSAYQKASKSAIQHAQLTHNTKALQQRRLQAASKTKTKLAAKGQQAAAARIKATAVRQTYLQIAAARESGALRVAAAHRLFKAQSVATQKQFAYAGEAIHSRTTTLQTLTNSQALTTEQALARKARITASNRKTMPKATTRKGATGKSPYSSIGAAAGRAAASRVRATPAAKTRTAAGHMDHLELPDTSWITAGNDKDKENCIAVAVANSLLYHTGIRVNDAAVDYLASYHGTDFGLALQRLDYSAIWSSWHVEMSEYGMMQLEEAEPGMLVGFEVVVDGKIRNHCGLLMGGNQVVSWGEIVPLPSEIDEVWEIVWLTTKNLK